MTREIRDGLAARIALSKELVEFDPFMPSGQALLFAKFILERDKSRDQAKDSAIAEAVNVGREILQSVNGCAKFGECVPNTEMQAFAHRLLKLNFLSDKKGGA